MGLPFVFVFSVISSIEILDWTDPIVYKKLCQHVARMTTLPCWEVLEEIPCLMIRLCRLDRISKGKNQCF